MANEEQKLTTLAQMRQFAQRQEARDEAQNQKFDTHTHNADEVTFQDGETFQEKFDSGDLTGPQGAKGATGVGITGITIMEV